MIMPKDGKLGQYTLNCADVARLLGYHVQYVRTLARQGIIPSLKRRRDWLFSEQEILTWLETQTDKATSHDAKVPDDSDLY